MANSEQSKWRDFLKPLVTAAAVALTAMAALAVYAAVCNTLKQINKGELPYALQQTNS